METHFKGKQFILAHGGGGGEGYQLWVVMLLPSLPRSCSGPLGLSGSGHIEKAVLV